MTQLKHETSIPRLIGRHHLGLWRHFEKKGLALAILGAISFPQLKTLGEISIKPLLYLVIGGGILAGSVGMLCFYAALKGAPVSHVMTIVLTAPLFGVLMGWLWVANI